MGLSAHTLESGAMTRPENDIELSRQWVLTGRDVVPQAIVKALQRRRDGPGLVYLASHLSLILGAAYLVYVTLGTGWVWLAMFLLGAVSVFLFAPMHECWHWTAFRTRWLNDAVGMLCGFLIFRPFFWARYPHTAHHTYTQWEDHDTDVVKAPKSVWEYLLYLSGVVFWWNILCVYARGATNRWNAFDRRFLPEIEMPRAQGEICLQLGVLGLLGILSIYFQSAALLWFFVLPRLLGEPVMRIFRMAEHAGSDMSPDLCANVRTTYTNGIIRFLYWQMPFHAEHHLYPSVPFHALAELNKYTAAHLRCTARGYWRVHRDLIAGAFRGERFVGTTALPRWQPHQE